MKKTSRVVALVALIVFAIGIAAGCGSVSGDYCSRLDECNALSGQTVDDCTEKIDKILDNLTSGQRDDCEKKIQDCLDLSDCTNFRQCIANLPC